jgi:hypothetical protein
MVKRYQRGNIRSCTIVLSVLLRVTASDNPFGIFWPLYCQYFLDLQLLILPLWYLLTIVLSVLLRVTASDNPFGIDTKGVISEAVTLKKYRQHNDQKIPKGLSEAVTWYLLTIVLSVLLRVTSSDNPFGIFLPLYCQYFLESRLLITPLVSLGYQKPWL